MIGNFDWTDERIAFLKGAWERKSAAEIAGELGTSKGSVIGKAHRLGLPSKDSKPPIAPPLSPAQKEYILGSPLTIMELTHSTCHWIITDLPPYSEHLYCGNETVEGQPYCPAHCRKAWARTAGSTIGEAA